MKPRRAKTTYELKTTLQNFKKQKVEEGVRIPFNIDPNFNLASAFNKDKENQADQMMAAAS